MICSRFVQNPALVQSIFRRLSLSTGDLRISSNLHNISASNNKKSVICAGGAFPNTHIADESDRHQTATFRRKRSYSTGHKSSDSKAQLNDMAAERSKASVAKKATNRLALEKSPYLLQHATNPVDWYPWGEEAFEKARIENKLIFLSVGYSTCHWCHVMEKESFECDAVAEIMNKHYVNVKVDREERPDVDKLYMTFIQATQGGGGWPMTVFLTPKLEPITGGTYFPPEDMYGRPGIKTVLLNVAEQWRTKQTAVLNSGSHIIKVLRAANDCEASSSSNVDVPTENVWLTCYKQLSRSYETVFGGFTNAPKFPQPSNFNFLFHLYTKDKNSDRGRQCLDMCLRTLSKMALGGIHDHVNTGFARYSVDTKWHVPHFEKMLYDQAQLVVSYCDAFVVTKDQFYADVVHDILNYVSRDLGHDLGGFYGAEDADSYPVEGAAHKAEGAFCVWEYDELCDSLTTKTTKDTPDYEIFNYHYGVKKTGNVNPSHDPHGELLNKNVLGCFGSYEETAAKFDISVEQLKNVLTVCHKVLYDVRQKRPKPHVDTKIVTSWNGLMISGFSKAGFVLKDQRYINRAILAANFIRKYLYSNDDRTLTRCCYKGTDGQIVYSSVPIPGFIDDYAFLIKGLLDLYEASLDADWLQWAEALQEQQDRLFWDANGSGYFTSPAGDSSILIRGKEDQDGAEPCGNSVAVHNLIRLAAYLDRQDLRAKAGRTLTAFADKLEKIPLALPEMTSALMFYHASPTQVFIAGKAEEENTQALLDVIRTRLLPGRILAVADGPTGRAGLLYSRHESLSRLHPIKGKPAAYVCRNFACSLPVTEPFDLAESLDRDASKDDVAKSSKHSPKSSKSSKKGSDDGKSSTK